MEWNPNNESADFSAELYGEDCDEQIIHDDDYDMYEELEDDAPSCAEEESSYRRTSGSSTPTTSPKSGIRRRSINKDRQRSRSPLSRLPASEQIPGDKKSRDDAANSEGMRLTPHAFVICASVERLESDVQDRNDMNNENDMNDDNENRARGVHARGRMRVVCEGCGRSNRGCGDGCRRRPNLQSDDPLEEICLNDDDVPQKMREMVLDVMRRRQARLKVNAAVSRSTCDWNSQNEEQDSESENEDSESEDEDVFQSVTYGRGLLEDQDLHFEWCPMDTFRGKEEYFRPQRTGSVSSYKNPYEAFRSYWDDGILQRIVDETNRYATKISSVAFQSEWYPMNSDELLCLFAFWMMAGIIRMPTICSYFANNSLLKTEAFSRIITFKRYSNLMRAIHFVDTDPVPIYPTNSGTASSDRMHCLQPVIDYLNSKFQSNYVLSKDIYIDESLTVWKSRLIYKPYIRSKAAKYGIKTFELSECATGYLWSFLPYKGGQNVEPYVSKSTAVVLKLIDPLLNRGYRLFMDKWFNSPYLARYLKRNGTDCVGTLRASCRDVPKIVTDAPLEQCQMIAMHSGDVCVSSWLDKKRIHMISTCHGLSVGLSTVASYLQKDPEPFKPQAFLDYSRSLGGVDLKDQMLEPYLLEQKRCTKWYLRLFKRLLNSSIHNSRVVLESSLKIPQDNYKFRLELIHAILERHHSEIPLNRRAASSHRKAAPFPHTVHHTHWPVRVEQTSSDMARNRQSRLKCFVCVQEGRKTQRTPFKCEDCNVPLCVEYCFKKYHTN